MVSWEAIRITKKRLIQAAHVTFVLFCIIVAICFFSILVASKLLDRCSEFRSITMSFGIISLFFTVCYMIMVLVMWRRNYSKGGDEDDGEVVDGYQPLMTLSNSKDSSKKRKLMLAGKVCLMFWTFIFVVILFALLIAHASYVNKTTPQHSGKITMKGLSATVTVEREDNGMIHIFAETDADAAYAQGMVMAQERLWQMEFQRRAGKGRLSEILGEAALDNDKFFLSLSMWNASQEGVAYLDPRANALISSFIQGINDYIATNPHLSLEFHLVGVTVADPFQVADVLLMGKVMSLMLSGNMNRELLRHQLLYKQMLSKEMISQLIPNYPPDADTILSDEDIAHINFTGNVIPIVPNNPLLYNPIKNSERSTAQSPDFGSGPKISIPDLLSKNGPLAFRVDFKAESNNWVINGSHTESGSPLLCNDPHLELNEPSIWLLMHLKGDSINVIGASIVGVPGVIIGRNDHIAWGVTNVGADVQDMYILEVSEDGKSYFHNGQWLPFYVRQDVIPVKGAATVPLPVRMTIYGPVMSDVVDMQGATAALRWVSLDYNDTTMQSVEMLMRATNFDEFRAALSIYVAPAQNFIYADLHGNIGYQCPGRIPVRPSYHDGLYPAPGNGSYDWLGWIPFDELPYTYNPAKGFIATANNRLTPDSYPYLILGSPDWDLHYRISRIVDMIEASNQHNVHSMSLIQFDQTTNMWKDFQDILARIPDSYLSSEAKPWKAHMLQWDGNLARTSESATVYQFWVRELAALGPAMFTGTTYWVYPYFIVNTINSTSNSSIELCGGDCFQFAANAFSNVIKHFGNPTVPNIAGYGEHHTMEILHQVMSATPLACLFDRDFAWGGDSYTPNLADGPWRYNGSIEDNFVSTAGPSYRQIIDLSNNNMDAKSVFVLPTGQSGNVLDPLYDNMLPLWQTDQYVSMKSTGYKTKHKLTLHP